MLLPYAGDSHTNQAATLKDPVMLTLRVKKHVYIFFNIFTNLHVLYLPLAAKCAVRPRETHSFYVAYCTQKTSAPNLRNIFLVKDFANYAVHSCLTAQIAKLNALCCPVSTCGAHLVSYGQHCGTEQ